MQTGQIQAPDFLSHCVSAVSIPVPLESSGTLNDPEGDYLSEKDTFLICEFSFQKLFRSMRGGRDYPGKSTKWILMINRVTNVAAIHVHKSNQESWAFENVTAFFKAITRISIRIQLKHRPYFLFELFSFFF